VGRGPYTKKSLDLHGFSNNKMYDAALFSFYGHPSLLEDPPDDPLLLTLNIRSALNTRQLIPRKPSKKGGSCSQLYAFVG
jgi:hypothetical protein